MHPSSDFINATEAASSNRRYLFVAVVIARGYRGSVSVYKIPEVHSVQTIKRDIDVVNALAVDQSGNLYVSNNDLAAKGAVTAYRVGTGALLRKISYEVDRPDAVTFDASGNVYVGDFASHKVTAFANSGTRVLWTITHGIQRPVRLRFDARGDLYVANWGNSAITVYAPRSTKLLHTIVDGIDRPANLTFDDSGNLYVCNNAHFPDEKDFLPLQAADLAVNRVRNFFERYLEDETAKPGWILDRLGESGVKLAMLYSDASYLETTIRGAELV